MTPSTRIYTLGQVVVMDRGLMDVQAYLNADQWKSILDANHMTEEMMAERLVAVVCAGLVCRLWWPRAPTPPGAPLYQRWSPPPAAAAVSCLHPTSAH